MTIEFLKTMPPAERRAVELAFAGQVTDKELARACGVKLDTARKTWQRVYYRLGLPFGARRAQAIVALVTEGWVRTINTLLLVAAIAQGCNLTTGENPLRVRSGGRGQQITRIVRMRRRLNDGGMAGIDTQGTTTTQRATA